VSGQGLRPRFRRAPPLTGDAVETVREHSVPLADFSVERFGRFRPDSGVGNVRSGQDQATTELVNGARQEILGALAGLILKLAQRFARLLADANVVPDI
jgi:hypothetical protein